jgi:CysZ protein
MMFDKKGNNPMQAAGYLIQGVKLLGNPGLRKFILIPILINLVLYSVALFLGYHYVAELINQFIPGWLHWLSWILWPLFFISFFIAGFFSFNLLANLLAAPFYGQLSSKTLVIITGQPAAKAEQPMAKVMSAELKRTAYFASRALPLVILSIIPVINLLTPVLWAMFGAWGMALEYMAYPLENNGLLFSEQKRFVNNIKTGALSFGLLAALGMTIPVLNIIVPPAAVIGATIYCHRIRTDSSITTKSQ